jgi:hypothetical protein
MAQGACTARFHFRPCHPDDLAVTLGAGSLLLLLPNWVTSQEVV